MLNCNLEVNNLMKDNCIEPALSLSLVAETSILRGRSGGKVMVLAQHRHLWGQDGDGSHSSQCRSSRGFLTYFPCSFDPSFLPKFWELLRWIFFLIKNSFPFNQPRLLLLLAAEERNHDTAIILPFASGLGTWQPLYLECQVCL